MSGSELLFYGGIGIMIAAVLLAVICIVIFSLTGRKLKKKLEKEFGKPQR
ncbi:MAG: hypothetical protein IJ379_01160 [Lachnospiraceae bacterium]|nr:hypothetical protein [Lachnospiraceae bacterium]